METVILTAIGVGASTVLGAFIGFMLGGISERFSGVILSFGAGVMLAAAVLGLILPSLDYGGNVSLAVTSVGVLCGGGLIYLLDRVLPVGKECGAESVTGDVERKKRVILFVMAIAIHNIPEGIASGVAFGMGNIGDAILVAGSVALQNLPEGMVLISPMISVGISRGRTLLYASLTGLVEVVGTLLGYFTVRLSAVMLPFFLSLAGGSMLYVIADEMVPETHKGSSSPSASFALMVGFLLMLAFDALV